MLKELKALTVSDIVSSIAIGIFLLGWIDLGQGTEYTWYNVIVKAAEQMN